MIYWILNLHSDFRMFLFIILYIFVIIVSGSSTFRSRNTHLSLIYTSIIYYRPLYIYSHTSVHLASISELCALEICHGKLIALMWTTTLSCRLLNTDVCHQILLPTTYHLEQTALHCYSSDITACNPDDLWYVRRMGMGMELNRTAVAKLLHGKCQFMVAMYSLFYSFLNLSLNCFFVFFCRREWKLGS